MENMVAKAALADTRGVKKAVAIIQVLLGQGLPSQAVPGLNAALAARYGALESALGQAPGGIPPGSRSGTSAEPDRDAVEARQPQHGGLSGSPVHRGGASVFKRR